MAGRRFLSLTALAAALVLLASTGTCWAHPGSGTRHAYGHHHVKTHAHGADRSGSTTNTSDVVRRAGSDTNTATAYRAATRHDHADGKAHRNLASHPGKALGLFKHADRLGKRTGQQHIPSPVIRTGSRGEPQLPSVAQAVQPQPTHNPASRQPTPDGNHNVAPPTSPPPSTSPPTQRPPADQDPASLAQVLLHSNPMRFTALPILVISVLALGVCGLIGLARHRA
jgi:hypothetical protein